MNKENLNTLIGTLLIGVLVFFWLNHSTKQNLEERKQKQQQQLIDSLQKVAETKRAADTIPTVITDSTKQQLSSKYGAFGEAATGTEKTFVIENDLQRIVLSSKGGKIKSVELKKYKTWNKQPLILFTDKNCELSYQFVLNDNKTINTGDFYFEPIGDGFTVKGTEEKKITFRLKAAEGSYIEQEYSLKGNSYLMGYNVTVKGMGNIIPSNVNYINVNWANSMVRLEHDLPTERKNSGLYFKYLNKEVSHLNTDKNDEQKFDTPLEWVSFKQEFFNATLFCKKGFSYAFLKTYHQNVDTDYVKKYGALFSLPFKSSQDQTYAFALYLGPNHYNTLKNTGSEFEDILPLGYDNMFFHWISYITKWFIIPVFNFFDQFNLNYGIIIFLMTLILKLLLTPLTFKSFKSAASMKLLKPELDELKAKYADDQQKLGTEQMKLYQKAGVSPFGGCLPMLLQLPILMSMYFFFPSSIELRQQPFLWATDLSSYDSIVTFSSILPLIGNHISLFTVLMTITSILTAVFNTQANSMNDSQPGMKYMPYIMPVFLMFLFNNLPAALTYYYLLQNLMSLGQQWIIQKFFIDEKKLHAQMQENKKNPKAKSGFQKRLEDIAKQAQDQQKGKKK